ncbi:DUF563 domain-containing protein [Acidisoma sp. L85]|uniref:glycosyltransferase family 61 protein n=1 Tax=Acidisoma sp. L85 TaxID=1641850 RepID=UPI00131AEDAC|nr:glycosyltransferase family 61 protein [Acidisoma sp. L85]
MTPNIVDLPESARVDTLFSPAFSTSPPQLRNAELLSPRLRELYKHLWNQTRPREEIVCSVVLNAIVEGPGLVFDADLNLIRQTIHQATPAEIEAATHGVHHYVKNGLLATKPGVTLLCEKAGIGNYGHWLIEMLPIAFLNLKHLCVPGGWRLRLPVAGSAMNAVMLASTELIGVPPSQIDIRDNGPQQYEQLVIMRGLSHHGIHYSPRIIDCMEQMAAAVPAQGVEKIWVSRVGERRSIADEAETCMKLAEQGWYIAEPGKMTLRDQISLFKGARRIAGVNGAGLTNLVFASSEAEITSFIPSPMPDVFFWMLAGFKGQTYREVRCRQMEDPQEPEGWNSKLLINISDILSGLSSPW